MLIQIHMLQNYVPSNLNRDDSGSPKSAVFGGYSRGRISSQCLKRSIRRSDVFEAAFRDEGLLADRTNRLPRLIDGQLEAMDVPEADRQAIIKRLPEIGRREGGAAASDEEEDSELKTKILVYLSPVEAKIVAEKLWALYQEVGQKKFADLPIKEIEAAMGHDTPRSVDIAMFGRMTTSAAFDNVEAAVQVAHAISTNSLVREFDYFTAVDDISGETGAGMIGDLEMNSSTYYKYFNACWDDLVKNLDDTPVALQVVTALIEAAALAQPSGKQNSTAAQNLPDLVLAEISQKNIPISYANAFLQPVNANRNGSLMQNSITALNSYAQRIQKAYGLNGARAYFTTEPDTALNWATDVQSLPALRAWVENEIKEALNG
jgi:CRISPR system Cascade subunit CasC